LILYIAPEFNLTSSGGVVPIGGVLLAGATPIEHNNNNNEVNNKDVGRIFDFEKSGEKMATENHDSFEEDNWLLQHFNNNTG
jgi:hypothetical protein